MKWRVLITNRQLQQTIDSYLHLFEEHGVHIELPHVIQQLNERELFEIIDGFDGIIAGDDKLTAKVLERGKSLKVIAKWGVGLDAIDMEAAERLGIRVTNTPDVFADEVADVCMGYIILLARQLHKLNQSVRHGNWAKIEGTSLQGKTLGVVGVGSIGRALVRRAVSTGLAVLGYDIRSIPSWFIDETGLQEVKFHALLQSSDFISLNCNLSQSNRYMISSREFAVMKNNVRIINTARGSLIDEAALVQALHEGKVAGAALDVFEEEPLPVESPLRQFDNCIFGTHNSSNTTEAVMRVNDLVVQNLLNGLESTNR